MRDHPLWQASCALLEPRGELEGVRERTLSRLRELNEDPEWVPRVDSVRRRAGDAALAAARPARIVGGGPAGCDCG